MIGESRKMSTDIGLLLATRQRWELHQVLAIDSAEPNVLVIDFLHVHKLVDYDEPYERGQKEEDAQHANGRILICKRNDGRYYSQAQQSQTYTQECSALAPVFGADSEIDRGPFAQRQRQNQIEKHSPEDEYVQQRVMPRKFSFEALAICGRVTLHAPVGQVCALVHHHCGTVAPDSPRPRRRRHDIPIFQHDSRRLRGIDAQRRSSASFAVCIGLKVNQSALPAFPE